MKLLITCLVFLCYTLPNIHAQNTVTKDVGSSINTTNPETTGQLNTGDGISMEKPIYVTNDETMRWVKNSQTEKPHVYFNSPELQVKRILTNESDSARVVPRRKMFSGPELERIQNPPQVSHSNSQRHIQFTGPELQSVKKETPQKRKD